MICLYGYIYYLYRLTYQSSFKSSFVIFFNDLII
nr:MAG TPA: hypothetical protein [Caudoviricetes sp.]